MLDKNKQDTILVVDDARDTLMLLEFDLSEQGFQVITAESGEEALNTLKETSVDLVLLDMYMPGLSGLATLEVIKNNSLLSKVPVIMLSASDDEDEIVACLDTGAADYVTKPYISKVLQARIRNALRIKAQNEELAHLAKTDFLTQLANRACFYEFAQKAVSHQNRQTADSLVVAICDIDFFKQVNDTYGHDVGDKVLIDTAKQLNDSFRGYDIVARIGGEEFAICMPNTRVDEAVKACDRFRNQLASLTFTGTGEQPFSITASIGISEYSKARSTLDELIKAADTALYEAKSAGRNCVKVSRELESIMFVEGEEVMPQDELPGIDIELGLKNVLNDRNLFDEILVMFYQDHHQDEANIREALLGSDLEKVKHLVHTLKGVASSIGASELFRTCKKLDEAVNQDTSANELLALFTPVSTELKQVIAGVKQALID